MRYASGTGVAGVVVVDEFGDVAQGGGLGGPLGERIQLAQLSRSSDNSTSMTCPNWSTARYGYRHHPATLTYVRQRPVSGSGSARPGGVSERRREPLHPPVHRHVIDLHTTLGQQLLRIPIGQPVPQIPADRDRDHLRREPQPRERRPIDLRTGGSTAGSGSAETPPAWCLNLRRDPHARIVVAGQSRRVVAGSTAVQYGGAHGISRAIRQALTIPRAIANRESAF